jgi:hypothetical protein
MWLGERDDDRSNPVAISVHPRTVGIYFSFVRYRRSPEGMRRFADAMRTVPGVASYIEGFEQQEFGMRPGMKPTDVLDDDDSLEAWKRALDEASAPA